MKKITHTKRHYNQISETSDNKNILKKLEKQTLYIQRNKAKFTPDFFPETMWSWRICNSIFKVVEEKSYQGRILIFSKRSFINKIKDFFLQTKLREWITSRLAIKKMLKLFGKNKSITRWKCESESCWVVSDSLWPLGL